MKSVLIIDDEEKLLHLLSRIIKLEGFTVLVAGTLKTASKLIENESVDVILCDVKLPDGKWRKQVNPLFCGSGECQSKGDFINQ